MIQLIVSRAVSLSQPFILSRVCTVQSTIQSCPCSVSALPSRAIQLIAAADLIPLARTAQVVARLHQFLPPGPLSLAARFASIPVLTPLCVVTSAERLRSSSDKLRPSSDKGEMKMFNGVRCRMRMSNATSRGVGKPLAGVVRPRPSSGPREVRTLIGVCCVMQVPTGTT